MLRPGAGGGLGVRVGSGRCVGKKCGQVAAGVPFGGGRR